MGTDDLSFWDHLEDLRRKVLVALALFALFFLAAYFALSSVAVAHLVQRSRRTLYYLSVFEPFLTRLKVSALLAMLGSLPVLAAQVLRFVLPGLFPRERTILITLTLIV
jgi:sec-independent protein translocase protein TatC